MNTTTSPTTVLIPIQQSTINSEQIKTVNARQLHSFLEVGKDFSNWIKDRIESFGFTENQDFVCSPVLASKQRGGSNRKEYHLTIDMAKELSMVERNDKGKEARLYFLDCERQTRKLCETAQYAITEKTLDPEQQNTLQQAIKARFTGRKELGYAWTRFNNHFKLGSYKQLPADKIIEALAYIETMPAEDARNEQRKTAARFEATFDGLGRMILTEITAKAEEGKGKQKKQYPVFPELENEVESETGPGWDRARALGWVTHGAELMDVETLIGEIDKSKGLRQSVRHDQDFVDLREMIHMLHYLQYQAPRFMDLFCKLIKDAKEGELLKVQAKKMLERISAK